MLPEAAQSVALLPDPAASDAELLPDAAPPVAVMLHGCCCIALL